MNILFSSISISKGSTSFDLGNNSLVLKNTDYQISELQKFLSELVDFEYNSVIIHYKISVSFNSDDLMNNLFIRWSEIDEDRLMDIIADIVEELHCNYYEVN